ncbi:hypothetical protein OAL45_00290 [bacterium]|nr:hypothetical protein [bacterium]MDB4744151.1 hypothetical protein [Verrucomicrobiota bacterium]MDC0317874.1 hypothetical protein [bacterium]
MKPKPEIKVLDIVDNPNGSSLITFETNEAFDQMYLKKTGKKRLTKKGVGNYIKEILTKAIEEKDGFSIKKQ